MCRMIAAVGRASGEPLVAALRTMALNENPAHDHELRSEGENLLHDCGWGAAYVRDGRLVRHRSAAACFDDPAFESVAGVRSSLMLLHTRRTKHRDTIAETNSQPFLTRFRDEAWAFCHNGEIRDLSQLSHDGALAPEGTVDSELLFLHLLTRIDPEDPAPSIAGILGDIKDFTSLNCLLLRPRSLVAFARRDPASTLPGYYTLWRGRGPGLDVVSSEIVDGIDVEWEAVPDGSALFLAP
jgi:predicted glutamine amidotransferase